ncbi:hypothetical protein FOL47_000831 [Perkinsus chesapeaki]|uniref:Uncharacterized protein n=1 Tax=Perkinsus chesapeaki TaxID=330153 RepID=A0A7J6MLV9_PERCH|nr:hypothetical protein FOL47_000831 [Perkinsus chesapeaki]
MLVNALALPVIAFLGCLAYFPPYEYYCSEEATFEGALWALRFPRGGEPRLDNTMSIFHIKDSKQVFTWGIPITNRTIRELVFVQVDTRSSNFTDFADKYGLTPELWSLLLLDNEHNSVTIVPNSTSKTYELFAKFCRTRL